MHTNDSDAADMLRKLLDIAERQKNAEEPEGATTLLRAVTETAVTSDTVSTSTNTAPGWDWSENSEWGFDSW